MNLISSCKLPWPKVTNQVKTTSISWQVSSQISSHLAMWGVFGIQLLDNKTKGKGRRTQKNMNLGLGFGLLDGSFVCGVSHVHASLVLSILFHSFWVLCGSVQPPTHTSKHATSSMAVKPSYLSRELWGYCIPGPMQQYWRLFQLGNRWKTKPEHICHDMNCGTILHCTSLHPAPKNSLLQESAIISRFSGNSQLLLFANPPVCLWTSAAKNDWHIRRVEDFKINLKGADIQVAACPLSIMNHCDSFHLWPFFKSWVTQFSIFRFPTQNLLRRNKFGHPAEPIPSCSQWFYYLVAVISNLRSPILTLAQASILAKMQIDNSISVLMWHASLPSDQLSLKCLTPRRSGGIVRSLPPRPTELQQLRATKISRGSHWINMDSDPSKITVSVLNMMTSCGCFSKSSVLCTQIFECRYSDQSGLLWVAATAWFVPALLV